MRREQSTAEMQAEAALQAARDVQAMAQMPGWRVWTSWIEDAIEVRREALCRLDLDDRDTNRIRGEVQLLRQLLLKAGAALDIERFQEVEKHLKGLQAQGEARQYLREATQGTL